MPTLRIGLVGYGSWTRDAYISALRRSGRASVVVAASRSALTRQRIRTHADLELAFVPAVTRAAALLQAGALGKVERVGMYLQASWLAEAENDLSTVGRLAPWYVDVLNAIVGATPRRVFVLDGRGNPGRAQNFSCAHFDYGTVYGGFEISLASLGELTVPVDARGTDGELALNLFSGEVRFRSRRNPDWTAESWPAQAPYAGWPGMHESVASFLESVAKGTPSPNGALKMAQLNQVALAAQEAKDTGTWANVEHGVDR